MKIKLIVIFFFLIAAAIAGSLSTDFTFSEEQIEERNQETVLNDESSEVLK